MDTNKTATLINGKIKPKAFIVAALLSIGTVANAADPEYVTCRLKGCTKVEDQRVCVYHGVNNTVDTLFFRMDEWFPREFQCRYDPNDTKPPSIQETFEAIRKSQN